MLHPQQVLPLILLMVTALSGDSNFGIHPIGLDNYVRLQEHILKNKD